MRIIAGAARGRRLHVPADARVRPTSDRVREALFSSLQDRLPGARVLDLFAGTGALGLEALSRGAASVLLVERSGRNAALVRRNVEVVGLPGATVVTGEALAVLRNTTDAVFDLAFLDPPYRTDDGELAEVLAVLTPLLATDAVVIVERDRRSTPPAWPAGLLAGQSRRYGDTVLHRAARVTSDAASPADHEESNG